MQTMYKAWEVVCRRLPGSPAWVAAITQAVHEMVLKERYGGVMLWRNYAEVGGACTTAVNRKLSCLVFGRC